MKPPWLLQIAAFGAAVSIAHAQPTAAHVFVFDADPFVFASANVLASYPAADWSSAPTPLPGLIQVTAERFDPANGLSSPTTVALGPAPAAAAYVLVNQAAPDIAFFSLAGHGPAVHADADANGLPDAWEQRFFGRTGIDPNADEDGDGLSNRQEFEAGTNPNDALPLELWAEVVPPNTPGGFAQLSFELPGTGDNVLLESIAAFGDPWQPAEGVMRTEGVRRFIDMPLDPTVPARFFRLRRVID
jgi:hypothetical protein